MKADEALQRSIVEIGGDTLAFRFARALGLDLIMLRRPALPQVQAVETGDREHLVEEAAQSFEQPEAVIRWHYEKPERLNEYEVRAVERNVIDWALARANVQERPMPFSALMEPAGTTSSAGGTAVTQVSQPDPAGQS